MADVSNNSTASRPCRVRRVETNEADRQATISPPTTTALGFDRPFPLLRLFVRLGDVISGTVGSADRMDFTVIGDSVNLAARLCGSAARGELLVDQKTLAAAGDTDFGPATTLSIKGRHKRLQVRRWRVGVGGLSAAASPTAIRLVDGPVGTTWDERGLPGRDTDDTNSPQSRYGGDTARLYEGCVEGATPLPPVSQRP